MSDYLAAALVLVLVGVVAWRAADDAASPKVELVAADWSCRRSHAEPYLRVTPAPGGGADRALVAVMVCDSWIRR